MIRSISCNSIDKDYICSDIHGHFSLLAQQLDQINFNDQTDRLFSLGDLIDRGDESDQALEWLAKPWFFAIQGNHERMLINAYENQSESLWFQWMMWGGSWAEDMDFDALEPFYQSFSQLPLAIELALPDRKFVGLVHAELPDVCDWNEIKQLLTHIEPDQIEATLATSDMLWSKIQPYLPADEIPRIEPVRNIDHVFHGHTIVENYRTITNRTFTDLGSDESGRISLIDPVRFLND
ncbi:MAG: metallophosphoesterase [Cellvibrionaceae bacterium]|nr:metallophosphoesterase [Cellvibrionaceae bacterium]